MTIFSRNEQRRFKVDRVRLRQVAEETLRILGATEDTIGIILVNDRQIAHYNESFHHTAGPTDILTFPYPELVGGEFIISVERAVAHARQFHNTPSRELALYVVHGILHLHGHNDLKPATRWRMRAAERRVLRQLEKAIDFRRLLPVR